MVKVGQWPLYIIVEQGANVYTGAAFNVAYILALVVILSALISSLIIFILIDNFVKPIVKLRDASKKVTAGDLSARVEVSTGDEFEDLANNFNIMANKLQKNIQNIEKKIAERTANLEKLNNSMVGRELKMIELKNKIKNKK